MLNRVLAKSHMSWITLAGRNRVKHVSGYLRELHCHKCEELITIGQVVVSKRVRTHSTHYHAECAELIHLVV